MMMPPPAPLEMPTQRFDGLPPPHNAPEPRDGINLSPDDILTRRLLLVLLTGLLATAASASVKEALLSDGFSLLDGLLLLLFFPLFAWISFGFVTAAIGFILLISRAHPGITPAPRGSAPPTARTAVLVPVHNEDVDAVFDRIARMATMIDRAGAAGQFAFSSSPTPAKPPKWRSAPPGNAWRRAYACRSIIAAGPRMSGGNRAMSPSGSATMAADTTSCSCSTPTA